MNSVCVFVLVLAAVGVSAKPQCNTYQVIKCYNEQQSTPVVNTHIQTGVVENPTVQFPGYTPTTSVSESCHCLRTLVRPQLRNEIITVPTIDRIVRTVPSNVVEVMTSEGRNTQRSYTQPISNQGNSNGQNRGTTPSTVCVLGRPVFAFQTSGGVNSPSCVKIFSSN